MAMRCHSSANTQLSICLHRTALQSPPTSDLFSSPSRCAPQRTSDWEAAADWGVLSAVRRCASSGLKARPGALSIRVDAAEDLHATPYVHLPSWRGAACRPASGVILNLTAAKALGIEPSIALLARTDELIE
jgi:hypothetical protein